MLALAAPISDSFLWGRLSSLRAECLIGPDARKKAGPRQAGFSRIELLIVVALILILLSTVNVNTNKVGMNRNETRAIAEVRTLNLAQVEYSSHFGRFANTLGS
jgi:prepilin-type N-terminal cleavage/methylation domain-containing protein